MDIDNLQSEDPSKTKKGIRVTQQMILSASMCDSLEEVSTCMLREKNIEHFDDNKQDNFTVDDLRNIECLYLSHNLVKDVIGISTLTSLLELNLSFNKITDLS